ncbi:LRR receptor-like serine/threonine-protein kinase FLS2 (Protein FLAGELLIN-SENSING 2) (Protein FLAGELLIN-SENSITIVE 2), partial [Durusdinium trenchii]
MISVLPESVGNLQQLQLFGAINNTLSSLPESLGNLQSWYMFFNNNKISLVPESLGQVRSLVNLDLSNNILSWLPESLGNLQRLQDLRLSNNLLSSLPASIGHLQSLKQLRLSHNRLSFLPESVCNLQTLQQLHLSSNNLSSLPESLGNLQSLKQLDLQNNQLEAFPASFGPSSRLEKLDLASNKLSSLPDSVGHLRNLRYLHLQHNTLTSFFNTSERNLQLKVLLLNHNKINMELSAFCGLNYITTLYLHHNKLRCQIPASIAQLEAIKVLTLHKNALTGSIPPELASLPSLKLLTLHENRLTGEIPSTFGTSPQLLFLSAFANDLEGPIPDMKLRSGCVDDASFRFEALVKHSSFCMTISCDQQVDLEDFQLTSKERREILDACSNLYGRCSGAPSRGPTLLLQSNRLSCPLPSDVSEDTSNANASSSLPLRSLVIAGNMLGSDWADLPWWLSDSEKQPFLYISPFKVFGIRTSSIQRLVVGSLCFVTLYCVSLRTMTSWKDHLHKFFDHQDDHTQLTHVFLIQRTLWGGPIVLMLLLCYVWQGSYYQCGHPFLKTTLAYFESKGSLSGGGRLAELGLAGLWAIWVGSCLYLVELVPKPPRAKAVRVERPSGSIFNKVMWWFSWMVIVVCLSSPSLGYAFVQSLPKRNKLQVVNTYFLKAVHYGAALVMLLIDMLITPRLAMRMSQRSQIRRSMLLMAARTCTMWLNATLCAIYMSEHCMRGWTTFWTMCSPQSDLYHTFKVSLGSHELLDPIKDLCVQNKNWWKTEACPRSVVDTLAPLFVAKLLQRAFLQPVITLLLWKWSKEVNGELHVFPLACLGLKRWKLVASRSLDRAQQASFLVTLAEVMIIWSPLVPLLLPVACLAAMTNLLSFRIGPREFRAVLPTLEAGETASMSKKYIRASIGILLIFQMWFAFTSGLCGTSLIVLAAVVFLCEVLGLRSR